MKKRFLKLALCLLTCGAASAMMSGCSLGKVDYVGKMKLTDYFTGEIGNKNFLDNGIGYATVKKYVDGDTTHFNQIEPGKEVGRLVKARYLGVDTPESTGQIEPWGKAAKDFTHSKLESAKTIVLTTDVTGIGRPAETDSTGSRFKTLIWVSTKENAPLSSLRCVNLWLVQEGYSTGKGLAGSPITDYFTEADLQAQAKKLVIWSGKDDPEFDNSDAQVTTIQELAESFEEDGSETSWNGAKVRVTGIVYKLSGDYDSFLYSMDETTGKKFGVYIFAGYKYYAPIRTLGNKVEIVGTYTIFYGNPQITSVAYSSFFYDEKTDMKLISRDNPYSVDTKTVPEVTSREAVNMVYKVENLTVYSGYTEIDQTTLKASGALTLRTRDAGGNELSVRVPDDVFVFNADQQRVKDWAYFNGKTISLIGAINFYAPDEDDPDKGYYQIKLCSPDDFFVVA